MEKGKKGRYKYSQEEKDRLKVLKMQENDLNSLADSISSLTDSISSQTRELSSQTRELEDIRRKAESLARKWNVEIAPKATGEDVPSESLNIKDVPSESLNIKKEDIPSWDSLVERANSEIKEDIQFEDLLSKEEFNYCIEDVKRINDEFCKKTSIVNKRDLSFLAIAIGLQTARWLILQEIFGDLGADNRGEREHHLEGDKRKKKEAHDYSESHQNRENKESTKNYPTWQDIVFGRYECQDGSKTCGVCPYDAQNGGPIGFEKGGRGNHRVHTLGHDPLLGWIFGTANLMTCSISLSRQHNFANYKVEYPYGKFGTLYPYIEMFYDVFESTKEDKLRLFAALFAQGAHLRSDFYTEKGLPIPLSGISGSWKFSETEAETLAGKLYSEQYDSFCLLKDLTKIEAQARFAILIDMIIGLVHKMLYDESKDGDDKDLYEVRTRKILLISNIIASEGNVLYCAFSEDWKKLDIGGILVSLYRLVSDTRFMTRIKEKFIQEQLDATIAPTRAKINSNFID